jgi:hypothetical protein
MDDTFLYKLLFDLRIETHININVMKTVFKISIFCTLLLWLSACNSFDQAAFDEGFKDENVEYKTPTTVPGSEKQFTELLHGELNNKWKVQEFSLEGMLGTQSCRLDDTMILGQDGTYQFDGGKMSCGGEDVITKSGTYRIDFDNKKLIFDENSANKVIVNVSGLDQGVIALDGVVFIFGVSMTIRGVYTTE